MLCEMDFITDKRASKQSSTKQTREVKSTLPMHQCYQPNLACVCSDRNPPPLNQQSKLNFFLNPLVCVVFQHGKVDQNIY